MRFNIHQEISSSLALVFVMILSTAVAMGTVIVGLKVAENGTRQAEMENAKRLDMIEEHLGIQKEKRAPALPEGQSASAKQ